MVPNLWPGVPLKESNHYTAAMAAVVLDRRSSDNLSILGSSYSGISNLGNAAPCPERAEFNPCAWRRKRNKAIASIV